MKGEPSPATLAAETRLVASSCDAASIEAENATTIEMRAAVDASFKRWQEEQPACWEAMRQRHRFRNAEAHVVTRSGGYGLGRSGVGRGGGGRGEGIGLGSIGTIGHGAGAARAATKSSGTNNQVAGVDEADIVKTDGKYVYIAADSGLRIIEAMNPRLISRTSLPGMARELFVSGERAVVYTSSANVDRRCTYGYDCQFGGDGTSTKVSVFDVSNRSAPRLEREISLSGALITARRIGTAVHTVVADNDSPRPTYAVWPSDLATCGTPEATVRAKFAKLKADNEKAIRATTTRFPTLSERGVTKRLCDGLLRTGVRDGQVFTTLMSFDLADDTLPPTTATLQSRPGAVFASGSALYMSVVHQKPKTGGRWYSYVANTNELSEIHKFRIGSRAEETGYVGSGTVPGHVLNQFAMDEWFGDLRVATTKGRVPDPHVESVVSILSEAPSGSLVRIGAIDRIAPGEDIRSVRFEEDRGYVVTFKKTDPLFVMDLMQPTRPKVLGELKIPGFSTYMHRIDPEHLLSIGFDANDHGSFAYFNGVILQLFDVKEPTQPKLVHKEKIGTRGSSSEAATNHLAFNYFASEGLLAIPMTICEGGADGRNGDLVSFSGLLVYDVDLDRGFTRLGGVDHSTKGVSCQTWWSNANSAVKRSVFLDDLVYSISEDRVKVQNMNRFGIDVADLSLQP